MAIQVFLVHLEEQAQQDDDARAELAELTHRVGGFILMATNAGSLIAAFDEQWVPLFNRHRAVAFCGGVMLDPKGAAVKKLQQMFAANVAAQLAGRQAQAAPQASGGAMHRPLRWHAQTDPRGTDATGVRIATHFNPRGAA
jgi:hypothetical protein